VPPTDDLSREELIALIGSLVSTNESLTESNAVLRSRIAELERRLGRNSGNSSLPPSSDDRPGVNRAARRAGRVSGRKRGKQPGAPGSGLAWVEPDVTEPYFPQGTCECGQNLSQAADAGVIRSHQVHDLPKVRARVTQHDLHRVRCGCGREHEADRPAHVAAAPTSYGPNVQALAVYLLVFQHLPVERAALLIADLTGITPSVGYLHSTLARGAAALETSVARIKDEISTAPVVGFDETTLRVGAAGRKMYVLSANTSTHSLFWLGGRDLASFHAMGVLDAFTGIAVHDRYSVYDHPDFAHLAGHQLCTAHLLRDLEDAAECYPTHEWPAQAQRALRALIHAANTARAAGHTQVPARLRRKHTRLFHQAVLVGLSQIPSVPGGRTVKQLPARALLECLRDREADVLRFTRDTRVPPTNNISERGLRPEKTQQKISGRLPSLTTTRHRLTIRSYLHTAAQHKINLMEALRDAMTGNPWTPPALAPS